MFKKRFNIFYFATVPPPGNREQETPPPLQLLEVMPWPSSVARRQAMEGSFYTKS